MSLGTPPKLLILPRDRSGGAFVCTLAHPRNAAPSRYFIDPDKGVYEFTQVSGPKNACRSWLVTPTAQVSVNVGPGHQIEPSNAPIHEQSSTTSTVISKSDLLIATPIDPLFLLLPALVPTSASDDKSEGLFLSCDDVLDKVTEGSSDFEHIARHNAVRILFEKRLQAACDTVQAGDESMYRLSKAKLLGEIVGKAVSMEKSGLPASLEEKFINRALDVPIIGIKREQSTISEGKGKQDETPSMEPASSLGSQTSTLSREASSASVATDVTVPDTVGAVTDEKLQRLLRIRTVLTYIISSYVPAFIAKFLNDLLGSNASPIDLKPLEQRLAHISMVRAEALAARSFGDYSRKRNAYGDDDMASMRAEKKQKKEEEERKKKLESRGVKNLKKADTTGMKKMGDFFSKKPMPKG